MTLGVVLGAGFSKAVDAAFPLVDELGELVRGLVPEAMSSAPPRFLGGSFERWLSRIAEPQPDLDDVANLANARDFARVTSAIHRVMVSIEATVFAGDIPWWLLRLVRILHELRATVVTFNYDTLVEAAAARVLRYGQHGVLNTDSLTDGIPPTPPVPGQYGPVTVETFRLLKLHGSLDTYWVPGDAAGTSILRAAGSIWAPGAGIADQGARIARNAPGRVPFIVPPASAKSAFFANPITRQLWQTARERLAQCDEIAVLGYSMPMTDLVATAMIVEAQKVSGAHVSIVNPSPEPVSRTLCAGGVDAAGVSVAAESCEGYVDELERRLSAAALKKLKVALGDARPLVVAGAGTVLPVIALREAGSAIHLEVGAHEQEVQLRDTSTWIASSALLHALERTGARHVTVTVEGETAHVLGCVLPVSHLTDFLVLDPSAVRPANRS